MPALWFEENVGTVVSRFMTNDFPEECGKRIMEFRAAEAELHRAFQKLQFVADIVAAAFKTQSVQLPMFKLQLHGVSQLYFSAFATSGPVQCGENFRMGFAVRPSEPELCRIGQKTVCGGLFRQ